MFAEEVPQLISNIVDTTQEILGKRLHIHRSTTLLTYLFGKVSLEIYIDLYAIRALIHSICKMFTFPQFCLCAVPPTLTT